MGARSEPDDLPVEELAAQAEAAQQFAANMARVLEQSQQIWAAFLEGQMKGDQPLQGDPLNLAPAFTELAQSLATHPERVAEVALDYWTRQAELWRRMTMKALGVADEGPVAEPAPGDKRFRHPDWSQNVLFDYLKQSYLLAAGTIQKLVDAGDDELDPRDRKKVAFFTRQFIEALSPSNFFALNPEVLRTTVEEKGENLVRGLQMMLEDLQRGKGRLLIRQTDMERFEVGRNMAVTPGKVIFQNEIMQLIQYAPTTETVHRLPLLFVPPWINKYYVLDLNPEKSMVRWLVDQGHTVFMISWVNPDERQKDETWESYMLKGPSTAIDKVLEETGEKQVNIASYCIGGTLTATLLAWMAARRDRRVKSATFLTTLLDFADAGELQVFVDEKTLEAMDEQMEKGYLPAEAMATAFNMLRASDLIWGYVVNNYLLGREPFPFDLLYWNSDSTAMPAKVHHFYLDTFYNRNALVAGEVELGGVRLDLGRITLPVYHLATKEDHIAPAPSVYLGARQMKRARARFVLAGSGHIAGVVNPPAAGKYQFWTRPDLDPATLEEWLAGATEHPGSWWPDWDAWLAAHSRGRVPARAPGRVLTPIEDAPGSYVKVRFDRR
ncbi:MAG: class I poly(R)-hydroxyalkanoic acid synthase [Paracoccaceae bacterium]|nr:MAG: class I poly(R)-hydroxyalkanoic acid synthase [Paracoccaceae bacterium]